MATCPICGGSYKNQHGLSIHMGRMHKNSAGPATRQLQPSFQTGYSSGYRGATSQIPEEATCHICGRGGFKGSRGLSIHIGKMHGAGAGHGCVQSSPRTPASAYQPSRHVAFREPQPSPDYSTSCDICGRSGFKGSRGLAIHMGKMHTGQESSGLTPVTYDPSPSEASWVSTPSPDDSTTCDICGRSGFRGSRGLAIHMGKMHSGQKSTSATPKLKTFDPVPSEASWPSRPAPSYDDFRGQDPDFDPYSQRQHRDYDFNSYDDFHGQDPDFDPYPQRQHRDNRYPQEEHPLPPSPASSEPPRNVGLRPTVPAPSSYTKTWLDREPFLPSTPPNSEQDYSLDPSDSVSEWSSVGTSQTTQHEDSLSVLSHQERQPRPLTHEQAVDRDTTYPKQEYDRGERTGATSPPGTRGTSSRQLDVEDESDLVFFRSASSQITSIFRPVSRQNPSTRVIDVHRGLACKDLMSFFRKEENAYSDKIKYDVRMLRPDGREEEADDNGGVTRDALTEFWETFYMQYTVGNSFKVPCIRHDMSESHWQAVAMVLLLGYKQEGIFPIKLALPFMEHAITGEATDTVEPFLKHVAEVDRDLLETALTNWDSDDEEDLIECLERYEAKKLPNKRNIKQIVKEIAHKELVQKPSWVAEKWREVLGDLEIDHEELLNIYEDLKPTAKKVLKMLAFPEKMTPEETKLEKNLKRLIRELDSDVLGLFLRFCTGTDLLVKRHITVTFVDTGDSDAIRSPSSRTCGSELILPSSYGKDQYVALKSDFSTLLRNNYWQMDLA